MKKWVECLKRRISLQKLTPIRGRKQEIKWFLYKINFKFTEVNPDKGTETGVKTIMHVIQTEFTEVNPDKGTETKIQWKLIRKW